MRTVEFWSTAFVVVLAACACTPEAANGPTAYEPESSVNTEEVAPASTLPVPAVTVPEQQPHPTAPPYPLLGLDIGDEGAAVERLQTALEAAGFRTGVSIDGHYGPGTASAVLAFEKYHGLERDGVADPAMLTVLGTADVIGPTVGTVPAIDIDLERQILFARTSSGELTILNTSTGNGELYRAASGRMVRATTPTGQFRIERRIDGVRRAYLGSLYRPLYFKRGWAIHGSASVPAFPASHGCARVRNNDQDWLFETFADGVPVNVHASIPDPVDDQEQWMTQ